MDDSFFSQACIIVLPSSTIRASQHGGIFLVSTILISPCPVTNVCAVLNSRALSELSHTDHAHPRSQRLPNKKTSDKREILPLDHQSGMSKRPPNKADSLHCSWFPTGSSWLTLMLFTQHFFFRALPLSHSLWYLEFLSQHRGHHYKGGSRAKQGL